MRVPAALLTLCLAPLARGLEGHSRVFTQGEMAGLLRRVSENNDLRGQRLARFVPFLVDGRTIGYVQRGFCVDRLAPFSNVFSLQGDEGNESAGLSLHFAPLVEAGDCQLRTDALAEVTASLRSDGLVPGWRDELVAAVSAFGLAPAFTVERAFYPSLGIRGFGVHVNGFVRDPVRKSVTQLWVARRSRSKSTWPGMLDHLVAGGVAAGVGLVDTVLRECAEEASIPAHIALQAVPVGAVSYSNVDAQGNLKRDVLFCYDLGNPPPPHAHPHSLAQKCHWTSSPSRATARWRASTCATCPGPCSAW